MVSLILLAIGGCAETARPRGAVAADHPLASEAGASMLRQGGNAVDAAIAAVLSQGVVQPSSSGLGGGGFAIVVTAKGEATGLDFREVAPAAATRDMFAAADSRNGGLAVAVPAEAFGLVELHRRFGTLPLATIAAPALSQARDGFETGTYLASQLPKFPEMTALFEPGNRRPRLADTIQALVETGDTAFRSGWVAQDVVEAVRVAGGVLTMEDLASYRVKERTPLIGTYGAYTVVTMPPPSSGGVALLQMLAVGAKDLHCDVESAKHAMADRAAHGGDPDFAHVDVPALLAHAATWTCPPTTQPPSYYGAITIGADAETLHVSVIDGAGLAVSLTTTINTGFGSQVIAPRSGILLNNEMDDFAAKPGQPNFYGLVQGEANAIVADKRPLSSMTPTVVLDAKKRPMVAIGASGGPRIITATYEVLRMVLDQGLDAEAALATPRWHHQWLPDEVTVDPGFAGKAALEAHGHKVVEVESSTAVEVVVRRGTRFDAASDPRKSGEAVILR